MMECLSYNNTGDMHNKHGGDSEKKKRNEPNQTHIGNICVSTVWSAYGNAICELQQIQVCAAVSVNCDEEECP